MPGMSIYFALPPMIWGHRVTDDHITKQPPFEMSVDIKDIGADGFTAAPEVVGLVVDLPTAP